MTLLIPPIYNAGAIVVVIVWTVFLEMLKTHNRQVQEN
jgi:hypothetical protein